VIPVFSAEHLTEAHLIRGYLQGEGIPSEVRGGDSALPENLPEIWVLDDSQAGLAIEAISAYQNRSSASSVGAPWQCSDCGEQLAPQFNTCWKCGSIHPAFR
jgi:hypothetical protein